MKNLFIDSNIWLSLYHFTNDDLTQFEKLNELLKNDIHLWIPKQVHDEVVRNREAKIKESFKHFEIKNISYPVFCQEYDEYKPFKKNYDSLVKEYSKWLEKLNMDIKNSNLPADKTIRLLFETAGIVESDSVISKAYNRYCVGNPPGKDNKYGDAVNWECLLQKIPDGEDLYFISADKDYRSFLVDDMFNPFLEKEWKANKHSSIYFYTNLVSFLREHDIEIELAAEYEKQKLIEKLDDSCNFLTTHSVIKLMNTYSGWTEDQVENICLAAKCNSQVGWLLGDDDVFDFYSQLLSNKKYKNMKDNAISYVLEQLAKVEEEKSDKEEI